MDRVSPAALVWLLGLWAVQSAAGQGEEKVSALLAEQIAAHGHATMIVELETGAPASAAATAPLAAIQDEVTRRLAPAGLTVRRRFTTIPFLIAEGDAQTLEALARDPWVVSIAADLPVGAQLAETATLIGAAEVIDTLGFDGTGVTVAILDTGVDPLHGDLAGALIAERAFLDQGGTILNAAPDGHGHGTQVAGVITGDGLVAPRGIAPGSDIIAIKVLGDDLLGFMSDVASGLDWLTENIESFPALTVANISLGDFVGFDACPCDSAPELQLILAAAQGLAATGVLLVASSGNGGFIDRISAPACLSVVRAIGATYDESFLIAPDSGLYSEQPGVGNFAPCLDLTPLGDSLPCFTNRGQCIVLMAPGYRITTSSPGLGMGEVRAVFGTSFASAHVAGAIALMKQKNPIINNFFFILEMTVFGTAVFDAPPPQGSGRAFTRIDVRRAIDHIPLPLSGSESRWRQYQ